MSMLSKNNIVYSKISGDIKSSLNSFLIFSDFSKISTKSEEKKYLNFLLLFLVFLVINLQFDFLILNNQY